MRERLLELIEQETEIAAGEQTRLDDLGLDSLDYLDLMLKIGQMEDVDIPAEAMVEFETVDDVLRWLEAQACA